MALQTSLVRTKLRFVRRCNTKLGFVVSFVEPHSFALNRRVAESPLQKLCFAKNVALYTPLAHQLLQSGALYAVWFALHLWYTGLQSLQTSLLQTYGDARATTKRSDAVAPKVQRTTFFATKRSDAPVETSASPTVCNGEVQRPHVLQTVG